MQRNPVFCSIASAGYVSRVKTCLDSVREHHPGAEPVVLAIDADTAAALQGQGLPCLRPEACIPPAELAAMRQRYSLAELCFAVKPYLMLHLLQAGAGQVHYLDGDCLVLSSLEPLVRELAPADVLLTPHSLTPIPADGRTPRALTVLRGGVFNAGYVGLNDTAEGRRFVQWWAAMTTVNSHNAPSAAMCGDQRWLDLVPVLFPGGAICRHPGANAGYWNLHERQLTNSPGGFRVNDQALLFFHFSGYRLQQPQQLSQHQNRHVASPGSGLFDLLMEYRRRLQLAEPPPEVVGWRRKLGLRP